MPTPKNIDEQGRRVIPPLAIETSLCVARYRECAPGDELSYDELTELMGKDARPGGSGYAYQLSARNIAEREHGITLVCNKALGLLCLADDQKAESLRGITRSQHSLAKRGAQRARAIGKIEGLPEDLRHTVIARWSCFAAVAQVSRPAAQRRLEAGVNGEVEPLPLEETLAFFLKPKALVAP